VERPVFLSRGPAETRRIGARLGRLLEPGDVLLLQGELGSGKTVLAQGIGQGLAVREPVKSSSFVLLNEYHGRLTLYHADLYRLEDSSQVAELALEEIAEPGILIVEWPERAWQEMPPQHLLVRIEEEGDRGRRLTLEPRSERYVKVVRRLMARGRTRRSDEVKRGGVPPRARPD
jgi:tRNA threonylcarbamoyladenosine biosynthesis protein TsaE